MDLLCIRRLSSFLPSFLGINSSLVISSVLPSLALIRRLISREEEEERREREMRQGDDEAEIERLPLDLLSHVFFLIPSFQDLARASGVCRKWRQGVDQSFARKERLSFAGWKMDDDSTARILSHAYSLKELDIGGGGGCLAT
ncbi:hypothetical protein ACLOJK_035439 [Asimina triloba]